MNQFKLITNSFLIFSFVFTLGACKDQKKNTNEVIEKKEMSTIEKKGFGVTKNDEKVEIYILTNDNGMRVEIMTYGGIITSLTALDKNGTYEDIVLGFDSLENYFESYNPYFGALIGRYGNRIANGKFSLDNKEYTLTPIGKTQLHGGTIGFDKVVWTVLSAEVVDGIATLKLKYLSKDGEEGYPGNLESIVTYTLDNEDAITIHYEATTDKKTVVNLTQHSYFNLSGDYSQNILDHEVMIDADAYTPVAGKFIPTGELAPVEGTPFDFRIAKAVGKDIDAEHDQIKISGGYDHNWVLNNQDKGNRLVATAYHPTSGRFMEVFSTEPGVQFYTANFLNKNTPAKGGGAHVKRGALCFETQHYPDSPNQSNFPSTTLDVGEKYDTTTTYKFSSK